MGTVNVSELHKQYANLTEKRVEAYRLYQGLTKERNEIGTKLLDAFVEKECGELGVTPVLLRELYNNAYVTAIKNDTMAGIIHTSGYRDFLALNGKLTSLWRKTHEGLKCTRISPALVMATQPEAIELCSGVTKAQMELFYKMQPLLVDMIEHSK